MTPPTPKTPRATTIVGRDRDVRETKTPPPGSAAADALERGAAPIAELEDLRTDPNASDYETLQRRAHRAALASAEAASTTQEIRQDLAATNLRIDNVVNELGDFRTETGKAIGALSGEVKALVKVYDKQTDVLLKQLDAANEAKKLTLTAELNVGTQKALVPVEDARARRANWRTIVLSIFGAGGIAFAIVAFLTSGKAC